MDIAAVSGKGILVTNTPGVNSQAAADLALELMLSAARKVPALDRKIRNNEWPRATGVELYKKTLGIIGLGGIGKEVAMSVYNMIVTRTYFAANISDELLDSDRIDGCTKIIAASVPLLVAYPFVQKYFVKGVMIGAIKG